MWNSTFLVFEANCIYQYWRINQHLVLAQLGALYNPGASPKTRGARSKSLVFDIVKSSQIKVSCNLQACNYKHTIYCISSTIDSKLQTWKTECKLLVTTELKALLNCFFKTPVMCIYCLYYTRIKLHIVYFQLRQKSMKSGYNADESAAVRDLVTGRPCGGSHTVINSQLRKSTKFHQFNQTTAGEN